MNRKNKNIRLIILNVALAALAVILYFTGQSSRKVDFNDKKFTIEDTAAVDKIAMTGKGLSNTLEKVNGLWTVNDKYPLDPSMQKVLMAVLHNVRIHRKAPKNLKGEIIKNLDENGYRVSIYKDGREAESFIAGGNNISVAYFMGGDNEPYVVYLPGYDSYVSGIFQVSENDWRDRFVFSTSWAGLKKLELDYPDSPGNGFEITSGQVIPRITGVTRLDTNKVMNYIELYRTFAVDQYLDSGRVAKYDSLSMTRPWAILHVDAVSLAKPLTVDFFHRLPGDNLMVGRLNENQEILFSYERIKDIFKEKSYFRKQ